MLQASKKRFDADPAFKQRAKVAVARLQADDPEYKTLWQHICQASRVGFQAIYNRLDVQLEERGESFYNALLGPLVQQLVDQGVASDSNGAQVGEPIMPDMISLKLAWLMCLAVYTCLLPPSKSTLPALAPMSLQVPVWI